MRSQMDKSMLVATYFCLDILEIDGEVIGVIYPKHRVKMNIRAREGSCVRDV